MAKRTGALILAVLVIAGSIWLYERHNNQQTSASKPKTSKTAATPATKAAPGFDKNQYSLTDPASIWVIVNKSHPLSPKSYAPADLNPVGNGQYMASEAASALKDMLSGASAAGYTVTPQSGYRSYQTQVTTYNNEVSAYGQATADQESARPGYSEHQTGLAIDLGSGGCNITDCFADTPGGQWIAANAYKYGFLLRYPADRTSVTGYRYESWHFRYVGTGLATELYSNHVQTLEEYFGVSGGTTY